MGDELNDGFPAAAPEEPPSFYAPEREAYAARQLEQLRQTREAGELTAEQQAYKDRMQRAADFHAAQRAEHDTARQRVRDYAEQTNESPGNIHRSLRSTLDRLDRQAPANKEPEPDLDVDGFASTLGFDTAALGTVKFENADAARAETKAALDHILGQVSDAELLAIVNSEPAAVSQLRAEIERHIDALADPAFGYRGQRTAEQANAVDIVTNNAIRQLAAHHKLKAPPPSVSALIARSRLAVDENFRPGKRGVKREFAEPADLPRSIHHALQQCPY